MIESLRNNSLEASLVKSKLYGNMAWCLLQEPGISDDTLKLASEYSKNALDAVEASIDSNEKQAYIARALTLIASCYVKAGSAVTAEGLLQTSIETRGADPLTNLAHISALETYASLCNQWDKRKVD